MTVRFTPYRGVVQVSVHNERIGHLHRRVKGSTLWCASLSLSAELTGEPEHPDLQGVPLDVLQSRIERMAGGAA